MLEHVLAWFERCKRVLRLRDEYEIDFAVGVTEAGALGWSVTDPEYGRSIIRIRPPNEDADWKRTMLHECVHTRMGGTLGTEPDSRERAHLERGVEMMTRILYDMMIGGLPDAAVARVAAGCQRSLKTARVGAAKRNDMNAARIAEIAMALGAMELPEEAKSLVQELIGLAAGGGSIEPDPVGEDLNLVAPESDPAMANMPPAMRKEMSARMAAMRKDMDVAESATILARAKAEIGERELKPAWVARLNSIKRTDDPRRAYVQGLKDRAPAPNTAKRDGLTIPSEPPNSTSKSHDPAADTSPILLPGEDATKVAPHILAARLDMARTLPGGRAAVLMALARRSN